MEKLQCKACGSYSMVPMDVVVDSETELLPGDDRETRFYTCHVCGDNWLSVKETLRGDSKITFVHQMGMEPELKRVAHMEQTLQQRRDTAVDRWEYFLDDEEVTEDFWRAKLSDRRNVLKSICTN